jgi:hypothetical protein
MKSAGILFFVLSLLISIQAVAQDYAINVRGDTIRGSIKVYNYTSDLKIQVTDKDSKKQTIPIFQVKSYSKDNEIYHPVKGPNGYRFMKLLKEGYLSLYAFQQEKQMSYDGLLINKKDGTFLEVPNLNFKKSLRKYLEDCPSTVEKIEGGVFQKKDLQVIVEDYNTCVQKNNSARSEPAPASEVIRSETSALYLLEEKVKSLGDFPGKPDALEMISEVRNKISRKEKIPNFLLEGLKNSLKDANVAKELEDALQEIK